MLSSSLRCFPKSLQQIAQLQSELAMPQTVKTRTRYSERFTPQKSEKTVVDILNMSISCIAFLRGFFPEDHFEDSTFGIPETLSQSSKTDKIKIKMLKYGASDDSDMLLNWISFSIHDALEKKYLRAVNLCVLLNDHAPNDIFESYIFDINYTESSTDSITFNGDVGVSTSELTKAQIFNLLKRFILQTQSLPPLPQKRYLSVRLCFSENCPKDYYPEHFTECTKERPATMSILLSSMEEAINHCGEVDSIHHLLKTSVITRAGLAGKTKRNEEMIPVEPFDLLKSNKKGNLNLHKEKEKEKEKDLAKNLLIDSQVSQVTKDLCTMITRQNENIHDGQTQIPVIEENEISISCSCNSSQYLPYSSLIYCELCNRGMHRVCYSVPPGSCKFQCTECKISSDSRDSIKEFDQLIIYNIRKLINIFKNPKLYRMESVRGLYTYLGYTRSNIHSKEAIEECVINALSILIHDNVISLKGQKSFNYQLFSVDVDGVLIDNQKIKKGKYYLKFNSHREKEIEKYMDQDFGHNEEVSDTLTKMSQNVDEFNYFDDDSFDQDNTSKRLKLP